MARLVTVLLVLLTACATASGHRIGSGKNYKQVARDQVHIYRTFDQIPSHCSFEEVALVAGTGSEFATEGNVYDAMKQKAGDLGANAIVLGEGDQTMHTTGGLLKPRELKGEAVAIRVFKQGCPEFGGEAEP